MTSVSSHSVPKSDKRCFICHLQSSWPRIVLATMRQVNITFCANTARQLAPVQCMVQNVEHNQKMGRAMEVRGRSYSGLEWDVMLLPSFLTPRFWAIHCTGASCLWESGSYISAFFALYRKTSFNCVWFFISELLLHLKHSFLVTFRNISSRFMELIIKNVERVGLNLCSAFLMINIMSWYCSSALCVIFLSLASESFKNLLSARSKYYGWGFLTEIDYCLYVQWWTNGALMPFGWDRRLLCCTDATRNVLDCSCKLISIHSMYSSTPFHVCSNSLFHVH